MLHALTLELLLNTGNRRSGHFITEVTLTEEHAKVLVDLKSNARVATDADGRWELSQTDNRLWRWAAGGALTLLRLRDTVVAVVSVSDSHIPTWADHLTAATGFASSSEEWTNPLRLMGEAFKAIAIATPTGLLVPSFGNAELDALAFGTMPSLLGLIDKEEGLPAVYHTGLFNIVGAKLLPLCGAKEVVVNLDGVACGKAHALVVLDQATRGIDLMHAYELDLRIYEPDDISVFHTKELGGRAKNAEICLVELDTENRPIHIVKSFKSGKNVTHSRGIEKMSPVLLQTLHALQR